MRPASPSQIRTHRILGVLTVLHSAAVAGLYFGTLIFRGPWVWFALATSLWLWVLVLALHPGRSILRFLIPTVIAAALFVPCATFYWLIIRDLSHRWLVTNRLEKLSRETKRMILYSIDQDLVRPMSARKGYWRLGIDELILPDDMFNSVDGTFARIDNLPDSVIPFTGPTVNDTAEYQKSGYGRGWQILRKTGELTDAGTDVKEAPELDAAALEREPYKGPNVLGYAEITDEAEQKALLTALASGVAHFWDSALCHTPRHALHIETATTTTTFSICFECQNVYTFAPEGKMGAFANESFTITHAPQPAFDAALKRHGIPLSVPTP